MTSIVDEDDAVVAAAWAVLEDEAPEGTKNIRQVTDNGTEFVYRIDSEAVSDDRIDPDNLRPDSEFPNADNVMWRATRDIVKREAERRGLDNVGRSVEGVGGGNREEGNRDE